MSAMMRRRLVLVAAGVVVANAVACKSKTEAPLAAAPAGTTSASAVPADHLAVDEVAEGTIDALGLRLPRGYVVTARYPDEVKAAGPLKAKVLARYVEERVRDGTVDTRNGEYLFDRVRIRDNPLRDLAVRIDYAPEGGGARIQVRDLTIPTPPDLPNDEARFRAAGFRRDGQLLDPQHTE
jgi:hypothetical protein